MNKAKRDKLCLHSRWHFLLYSNNSFILVTNTLISILILRLLSTQKNLFWWNVFMNFNKHHWKSQKNIFNIRKLISDFFFNFAPDLETQGFFEPVLFQWYLRRPVSSSDFARCWHRVTRCRWWKLSSQFYRIAASCWLKQLFFFYHTTFNVWIV